MSLPPESLHLDAARRSISSNSSSTAPRSSIVSFSEFEFSVPESKPLPLLPSSNSDQSDPYLIEHSVSHPSQCPIPPLTTISQLAYALGPDNTPHTTEIDTIPCAGIRIPNGALTGLLAWRLVVRLVPPAKEARGWLNNYTDRRNSYSAPTVHTPHYTETPIPYNPFASISALSLPLFTQTLSAAGTRSLHEFDQKVRPGSVVLTRQPHASTTNITGRIQPRSKLGQISPPLSNALAVNFILDTSLPYSIISQDTLLALGYPLPSILHPPGIPPAMVTLSIQNITTRFHIARHNEASRLGVQFLHDAGVSVFFPKDGEGVGPVLYVESAYLLKDVPRTILLQRSGVKLTLPQRIGALFGFRDAMRHR